MKRIRRSRKKKYRNRSSRQVILGLFIAVFGCDKFNDVVKNVSPLVGEKKPNEEEVIKKNLRWLLKEISTLTGNKKLKPEDEPVKSVEIEGGHIVINKGYSENSDNYKPL